MDLKPMSPHPFSASGEPFRVFCVRCHKPTLSLDVLCDLHDEPGTFYCHPCSIAITAHMEESHG
jgi:hypothetical protein